MLPHKPCMLSQNRPLSSGDRGWKSTSCHLLLTEMIPVDPGQHFISDFQEICKVPIQFLVREIMVLGETLYSWFLGQEFFSVIPDLPRTYLF